MKFFALLILLNFQIRAEIIKNDALNLKRGSFSFADVCKYMGINETLIIDPKGPAALDCMGTIVNLNDFCQKKEKEHELPHENLALLRGVIDPLSKTVFCEKAESVTVSYRCQKNKNDKLCFSAKAGCHELNTVFAVEMEIHHSGVIDSSEGKILNCYFQNKNDEIGKSFDKEGLKLEEYSQLEK